MTNNTKPEGKENQLTKDWFLGLPDFKQLRIDKGLTLRQVEELTGISNPYLSQLETGKVKKPSFDTVTKLKILYGVDEDMDGYSMTDIERAFCFGYLANNDNNWRDNAELVRRVETFKKYYLKPDAHLSPSSTAQQGKEETVNNLDLGIEIVSAMKASLHDWDIESGRIDALMDTELDRIDLDGQTFEELSEQSQGWVLATVKREKERLHKQANFAAEAVLNWFKQQGFTIQKKQPLTKLSEGSDKRRL